MEASVDHKVSGGHVSRAEERQVLADLTGFPNLAAMLAFEETWKKKKQKKNKKKQQKIECETQNDTEQHHLKPGQMPVTEGPKLQEVVILLDNDDDEVMKKSQSCKMDGKDTMQSIEVKMKRESGEEEVERGNNVGVGVADHKVSTGYISKVDEYQMLTDLSDFPNLAAMLAFEATWKKNRKNNKNKKRKIEIRVQNDTEQHHEKAEQMAATEEPKLQDNGGMKNGQSCEIYGKDITELSEGTKKQKISKNQEEKGDNVGDKFVDHEVGNGHIAKADEYKMLTDLTGFPNLAAMLAFEATWRKNRKKKKNKKKNRKIDFQVPNNMEETQISTCKAVETTEAFKADDNVKSAVIVDLCLSSSKEEEVIADLGSSKALREMVLVETTGKRKENMINAQEDTVNAMEEDNWADSIKERKPFQTKPVKRMEDIVPRKLLYRRRYFDHPESSRGMAENDRTAVSHLLQKQRKPCFCCGSFKHNATHCKQVIDCFICYGRGHLANDCPEKHVVKDESSKRCLRCGDSGHDLFSCSSDYYSDDLKEIQCFICKAFGHLCCVDYMIEAPRQVSYECGQADHLGSECTKLLGVTTDYSLPHATTMERRHFARERLHIRVGDSATPQIFPEESKEVRVSKSE